MSLSDRETLELNELCNALIDGTLTDVAANTARAMAHSIGRCP